MNIYKNPKLIELQELYKDLPITKRVITIMSDLGLDYTNNDLVLDLCVFYVTALRDEREKLGII